MCRSRCRRLAETGTGWSSFADFITLRFFAASFNQERLAVTSSGNHNSEWLPPVTRIRSAPRWSPPPSCSNIQGPGLVTDPMNLWTFRSRLGRDRLPPITQESPVALAAEVVTGPRCRPNPRSWRMRVVDIGRRGCRRPGRQDGGQQRINQGGSPSP